MTQTTDQDFECGPCGRRLDFDLRGRAAWPQASLKGQSHAGRIIIACYWLL